MEIQEIKNFEVKNKKNCSNFNKNDIFGGKNLQNNSEDSFIDKIQFENNQKFKKDEEKTKEIEINEFEKELTIQSNFHNVLFYKNKTSPIDGVNIKKIHTSWYFKNKEKNMNYFLIKKVSRL